MWKKSKKEDDEVFGPRIKTYKMPLKKRIAYYWSWFVFLFCGILTILIVAPTIISNYENIWYYLLISPVILCAFLGIKGFIEWWYYVIRYKATREHESKSKNHMETGVGENGKGKTLSYTNIEYWRSEVKFRRLCWEYWKVCGRMKDSNYQLTLDDKEIIGSYKATVNGKGIPNLMTFPPVYSEKYRRFSYKLDVGFLKQIKRIPYLYVGFLDEVGAILNIEKVNGRAKNLDGETDLEDFAKDMRHFADFSFGVTEQNPRNIYLPFRSISCDNRRFTDTDWVLKPRILLWLFNKLQEYFLKKRSSKQAKRYGKLMAGFEEFINYCGFWRVKYQSMGNIELGHNSNNASKDSSNLVVVNILQNGKEKCLYFPRASELVYKTRSFRGAYKALNKRIEIEPWEDLELSSQEARKVLKSENLSKSIGKKN